MIANAIVKIAVQSTKGKLRGVAYRKAVNKLESIAPRPKSIILLKTIRYLAIV